MKILIVTNHSYMFYRFRKELLEALLRDHEVFLSTPFVGHGRGMYRDECQPPQHKSV